MTSDIPSLSSSTCNFNCISVPMELQSTSYGLTVTLIGLIGSVGANIEASCWRIRALLWLELRRLQWQEGPEAHKPTCLSASSTIAASFKVTEHLIISSRVLFLQHVQHFGMLIFPAAFSLMPRSIIAITVFFVIHRPAYFFLQFWAPGAGIQRDVLLPKVHPLSNLQLSNPRVFFSEIKKNVTSPINRTPNASTSPPHHCSFNSNPNTHKTQLHSHL
jgi:hypothetical protein